VSGALERVRPVESTFSLRSDSTKPVIPKPALIRWVRIFSIDESLDGSLVSKVILQILGTGFNLGFIDADAIDSLGIEYSVLILPGIERLPLFT
jgi:hypothetical protein